MRACKQCGLPVRWVRTAGRWHCHNPDGSDHWDLCSKTRFARVRRTGTPFSERRLGEDVTGFKTPLKASGEALLRVAADVVTGEHYGPTGLCRDCVPPWEACAGCPDALDTVI